MNRNNNNQHSSRPRAFWLNASRTTRVTIGALIISAIFSLIASCGSGSSSSGGPGPRLADGLYAGTGTVTASGLSEPFDYEQTVFIDISSGIVTIYADPGGINSAGINADGRGFIVSVPFLFSDCNDGDGGSDIYTGMISGSSGTEITVTIEGAGTCEGQRITFMGRFTAALLEDDVMPMPTPTPRPSPPRSGR